ncbi:MAG TPA: choice-of-anchor tandem repeat GloVer-containing protein [Verrucomicrobiae bacterium]|nr:choice-of-anchor tandem repeat GloVer-containing protein [Verrucomicrobiae bacterium]
MLRQLWQCLFLEHGPVGTEQCWKRRARDSQVAILRWPTRGLWNHLRNSWCRRRGCLGLLLPIFCFPIIFPSTCRAVTLTTLCSFSGTNGSPWSLIQGADGNFYGITASGGSGSGTVFRVTPDGVLTTLVSFNGTNGANPRSVVQGTNGDFYGTTQYGGSDNLGTVFEMAPDGVLTTLVSFNGFNGANPTSGFVLGKDGNFYGTTDFGGAYEGTCTGCTSPQGLGTIFQMTPQGAFTTLASFDGTNGCEPVNVIEGADGNFYGSAYSSGTNFQGYGSVFRMTPEGAITTLWSFNGANSGPCLFGIIQAADSSLWGTTDGGALLGTVDTVFRVATNGDETTLFSFNGINGALPRRLVQGSDLNLYGVTGAGGIGYAGPYSGDGTIFSIDPNGIFTTVVFFNGTNGSNPDALLQGSDGYFYGTTLSGGAGSAGTVFRFTLPLAPVFRTVTEAPGGINFTWSAVSGQVYQVEYKIDSHQANWSDLGSQIMATNGIAAASDTTGPDPQRFYRVRLVP